MCGQWILESEPIFSLIRKNFWPRKRTLLLFLICPSFGSRSSSFTLFEHSEFVANVGLLDVNLNDTEKLGPSSSP